MSFIIQAAAETGIVNKVANGAIANGKPVVIDVAGTVSEVANTTVDNVSMGAFANSFAFSQINNQVTLNAGGGRVCMFYQGASAQLFARHGTVSGGAVSWQTETTIYSASTGIPLGVIYDNVIGEWLFFYRDFSTRQFFVVQAIVSGATFTVRTPLAIDTFTNNIQQACFAYDSTAQKYVFAYAGYNAGATTDAYVKVITPVSGGTPTAGARTQFISGSASFTASATAQYDPSTNKTLAIFNQDNTTLYGVVFTVSGTSATAGAYTSLVSSGTQIASVYDASAQKIIVRYPSGTMLAAIATITGTTPSLGTATSIFNHAGGTNPFYTQAYDSVAQRFVFAGLSAATSFSYITGKISGGALVFGTAQVITSTGGGSPNPITYEPTSGKLVSVYMDQTANQMKTSVGDATSISTNLTTENFIGFADGAFTNGQTAKIQIIGAVSDAQSGLTAGQSYYVQNGGTLGLSPGGVGTVFAGTAISATEIIVKG